MAKQRSFEVELTELINRHSKENGSNTPDFILAAYLRECLLNFDATISRRDTWHGSGVLDAHKEPERHETSLKGHMEDAYWAWSSSDTDALEEVMGLVGHIIEAHKEQGDE